MYKKLKGLGLIVLTMVVAVVIWEVLKKFGTYSPASFAAFAVIITILLVSAWIGFSLRSLISDEMTPRKERRISALLFVGAALGMLYLWSNQGIVRELRIVDVLVPLMTTGLFVMFAIVAYSRFSGVFGSTQVVNPDAVQHVAVPTKPLRQRVGERIAGIAAAENPTPTAGGYGTLRPLPADPTITGNPGNTDPQAGNASSN